MNSPALADLPFVADKTGFPWMEGSEVPPQYVTQNLPKISIITPTFNQGNYIEATIRSVLLQNYPNLEYIIIDGGSTDNTLEIIKKYAHFIHFWVSEPDNGQSDAINKGLQRATGDVFNWLNSDDLLAPNALWTIGKAFSDKPKTSALIGYMQFFDDKNVLSKPYRMPFDHQDVPKTLISVSLMTQPALFYRLDLVQLLWGVDRRLYYCMDLDLWIRFVAQFGAEHIEFTDNSLSHFRVHALAKSHNSSAAYNERRAVFLPMLASLNVPKYLLKKLNNGTNNGLNNDLNSLNFDEKWNFPASFLHQTQTVTAYIIEHLLIFPHYNYPILTVFEAWFFSFYKKPFGRRWYFYSLPLRFVYRKIK